VVLDEMRAEDGGLGRKLRIELLADEPGSGGVERLTSQVEAGVLGDLLGRRLQHGLGDEQEVGEFEIVDAHVPILSRAL
jgi:hypothetical protein